MHTKIENHEYNLRQFIHNATRWNLDVIHNTATPSRPFSMLTEFVLVANSQFDDFKNQLRLEIDKPENGDAFETDIKDRFLLGIKQYYSWYNENKLKIESLWGHPNLYYSMLEIMKSTEREINKYYESKKMEASNENPFPHIFKNNKAFSIFERFHDLTKNDSRKVANYSFIFYAMERDKFILCRAVDFKNFLSNNFEITIDRIDSRQTGTNKRLAIYNQLKANT